MTKKLFLSALTVLAIQLTVLSPAAANECADKAYGVATLRGDAQYPEGWLANFSTIEITPPDEFVYGVLDGSADPQQFLHIKAKLRNLMDTQMGAGTLRAAARYRKRIDYQPDLSADPPTKDSMEKAFSASLSEPISIDALSSDLPQTFAFDFSNDPIPAGITDLYFIATFKGEIEGLDGTGVAIGIKDLNEPTHYAIWNFNDYFAFWGEPRTIASILSNPDDFNRIEDSCPVTASIIELYEYSSDRSVYIGFNPEQTTTPIYVAEFLLPPGHFSRMIVLLDVGRDDPYYILRQDYWGTSSCTAGNLNPDDPLWPTSGCKPYWSLRQGAVVNQDNGEGFQSYDTIITRQSVNTHDKSGSLYFCTDVWNPGIEQTFFGIFNQTVPPANDQTVGATAINFP